MLRSALYYSRPRARFIHNTLDYRALRALVQHGPVKHFSSSSFNSVEPAIRSIPSTSNTADENVYQGPLTATFRRLKIFSLGSFTLSFTLAPFIFVIDSSLPAFARLALAFTAISTSGVSTALVAWVARPYVSTLRRLGAERDKGVQGIEMTTSTLLLNPRITRVYDYDFLVDTQRPFAKWELAREVALPVPQDGSSLPPAGKEETIAETFNKDGNLVGTWVVRWGEKGEGDCRAVGRVDRHFNVHLELLR
ncbi:hypothetical protein E1B28_010200 [Marasmius oreades]|uniref:Uncharacterized protein n=1 Tax=Marasmius oreades TaxID=181124 RepID=A0A9P7RXU4_9AGAR|nr:uncharacterized protein E1B28_010200 [Marasmius oreades]KAG7091146.1 hypothetical protein E1B28_010200 [Marasmius oreades]